MTNQKIKKGELSGRVAFITGGSRGIGLAIAEAMAKNGAGIAICGRDKKALDSAIQLLKKRGGLCKGYIADATNPKDVTLTLNRIKNDFGRLDILVNNIGGVRQFSNFEKLTDLEWQEVFDVNIMSMVRFTRASFPLLRASPCGRVINIASVAGKRPGNFNPHYGAMKAAMIHLSKYLSNQWGKYGILVNSMSPHTVKGGVWDRDVASKAIREKLTIELAEEKMTEEVADKTVLHGVVGLDDVANLAVYLASDKAKFITGLCLTIDGGAVNSIF